MVQRLYESDKIRLECLIPTKSSVESAVLPFFVRTMVTATTWKKKMVVGMVSKFFHIFLRKWPWAFVFWGIISVIFKIADLVVPRPVTLGGDMALTMTCALLGAFFAGVAVFAFEYAIRRIRSRHVGPSQGTLLPK